MNLMHNKIVTTKANTHKDNNEIPLRAKEVLPGKVGGS